MSDNTHSQLLELVYAKIDIQKIDNERLFTYFCIVQNHGMKITTNHKYLYWSRISSVSLGYCSVLSIVSMNSLDSISYCLIIKPLMYYDLNSGRTVSAKAQTCQCQCL